MERDGANKWNYRFMKCKRCGRMRPEKLSSEVFEGRSAGLPKFLGDTMAGAPLHKTYPYWHPVAHPTGKFTACITSKFGAMGLRNVDVALIGAPPPRPKSAVAQRLPT